MAGRLLSDEQLAIKQQCKDFFSADQEGSRKYVRAVHQMLEENKRRLILNMQDLHKFGGDPKKKGSDLGHQLLLYPSDYVRFLDEALRGVVEFDHRDIVNVDSALQLLHVGFDGYFGKLQITPRELGAWHLNKIVCIEGVVTRTTSNMAKIATSVHWNEAKSQFHERAYRDQLSLELDDQVLPTVNVMPKRDSENNILRTEHGLCTYHDIQNIVLQERPEKAPVGSLPRSVDVRFENDLVDCCKPGDRAKIVGIFMPYTDSNHRDFSTVLVANNVMLLDSSPDDDAELLPEDLKSIKTMSKKSDIFERLSAAVAPSIFGHSYPKMAIILMMLGGVELNQDHHHIRGDIHLLLVGEPATAKSQLLRFVMKLAPLALSTTGKGSSGVGLTGAVTTDPETGDKTLAAGAMVLADRGVLCIDEFDKMSDNDRVAMHEAMEQGSVTIAKAGIQATLNGRCSVIAAANPVYGFYAVTHSVAFNVGLPESLLSRFDLLFIILDDKSSEWTRLVADHVLQNHRTGEGITIGSEMSDALLVDEDKNKKGERKPVQVYLSNNPYAKRNKSRGGHAGKLISIEFLRIYLQHAKKLKPILSDAAREKIESHWLELRSEQANQEANEQSAIYINPRTLESLIRLSTGHAKCRLSLVVEELDVDVAIGLLRHTVNARSEALESKKREKEAMEELHNQQNDEDKTPRVSKTPQLQQSERQQSSVPDLFEGNSSMPPPPKPEQKQSQQSNKNNTNYMNASRVMLDEITKISLGEIPSIDIDILRGKMKNEIKELSDQDFDSILKVCFYFYYFFLKSTLP